MRWHAESDNLVLSAVLVELWRSMATVAVQDKKTIDSSRTSGCILVEMLYPLYTKLVCRPAVI